jgi:hypothetical protein
VTSTYIAAIFGGKGLRIFVFVALDLAARSFTILRGTCNFAIFATTTSIATVFGCK